MIQTVICSLAILGTMLVALLAIVPTIGELLDARAGRPAPRRPAAPARLATPVGSIMER